MLILIFVLNLVHLAIDIMICVDDMIFDFSIAWL